METDEGYTRRCCQTVLVLPSHSQKLRRLWPLLGVTQRGGGSTHARGLRGDLSTVMTALDTVARNMETVPCWSADKWVHGV